MTVAKQKRLTHPPLPLVQLSSPTKEPPQHGGRSLAFSLGGGWPLQGPVAHR